MRSNSLLVEPVRNDRMMVRWDPVELWKNDREVNKVVLSSSSCIGKGKKQSA
jgi:hypothetical protein